MTVGCARCHDHKIDSIPQRDYYRLVAFFRNTLCDIHRGKFKDSAFTLNMQRPLTGPSPEVVAYQARLRKLATDLNKRKAAAHFVDASVWQALLAGGRDLYGANPHVLLRRFRHEALPPEQIERLESLRFETAQISAPAGPQTLCIRENGSAAPPTRVLVRGNVDAPGDEVEPRFPTVLGGVTEIEPRSIESLPDSSGRRTALAKWITDASNPLTARVMVNRIWQHHFGFTIRFSPSPDS